MKKVIIILIGLLLLPSSILADVNMTTNIITNGNVRTETNINNNGNTTVAINGVVWDYEPELWSRDRVGITLGSFYDINQYFYMPWELSGRTFNLFKYVVNIIHKTVDPDIAELNYQNEALRNMMKDIYGDQYDREYCKAKCKVGFNHHMKYVMCEGLKCHEEQVGTWYCDKPVNEDKTVGVYRFYFEN